MRGAMPSAKRRSRGVRGNWFLKTDLNDRDHRENKELILLCGLCG
jgi:hypothetical protein